MVLSFFEPIKAIFYENIGGAEKAPLCHLTYIFDPATNRVKIGHMAWAKLGNSHFYANHTNIKMMAGQSNNNFGDLF